MLRRCASTAARPSPPKARQIIRAKSGVELSPELLLSVLVVGGVAAWAGVAVSPWTAWNGEIVGADVGESVGADVGESVGAIVGVAVAPPNDMNGVGQAVGSVNAFGCTPTTAHGEGSITRVSDVQALVAGPL
jgi:hypothetical protein